MAKNSLLLYSIQIISGTYHKGMKYSTLKRPVMVNTFPVQEIATQDAIETVFSKILHPYRSKYKDQLLLAEQPR